MDELNENAQATPRHWRCLEELDDPAATGNAAKDEFAPGTVEAALEPLPAGLSRRGFLGLVGATAALAATACSRRDRGDILPYTRRPEGAVPGVATYCASAFAEGHRAYSVLVKCREGRPVHVTGNDLHPAFKGRTSPRALADILGLYDPDRLQHPRLYGKKAAWADVESRLAAAVASARASHKAVLLLTGACTSPTQRALLAALKQVLPTLRHVEWEPGLADAPQEASRDCYGSCLQVRPRLEKADVILSLGADFLAGDDPEAIAAFAARRQPEPTNRLWVLEGPMTLTGANADHRFPVRPSAIAALATSLAMDLHARHGLPLPPGIPGPDASRALRLPEPEWSLLLRDLKTAGRRALVLCGDGMPTEAHRAAHLLNAMLGAPGSSLELVPTPPRATHGELQALLKDTEAGSVAVALVWGVDPLYVHSAPAWKAALARVPTCAWMGLVEDETASQCPIHLPMHHWLEAWGDHATPDTVCLQQPTLAPLYDTRQGEDVLLALARSLGASLPADYHAFLKARWQRELYPPASPVPFERFFLGALHDGFLARDGGPLPVPPFRASATPVPPVRSGLELALAPSRAVHDGRYANNAWLQELPDPVHKVTWGNPLSVSLEDARAMGLKDGDLARLETGSLSLVLPVILQPGQAPGVLSLALGHGRAAGTVARASGTNAFPLLEDGALVRHGIRLTKVSGRQDLARTQAHHRLDGRDLVRSWTAAESRKKAREPQHEEPLASLYPDQAFPEHKWGMAIDLAACVGCSSCVLACHSENNVGIVGPDQVAKGREMHWIRIDRYFEGDPANPAVVHQPMLCQQCDNAPCENVCPVNATNHSPEGLNQMTYNRCVGTRYCANNCPYKVRRFNFLEATAHKREPETLAYNPEVTVRPRGVMEKCTFCVQRIQEARMQAKAANRPLKDGDVVPACAAACPAGAIVFGDLKDPHSRVSKLAESHRRHKVLEELGVKPAITYLAHLRNPAGGSHEG